MLQVFGRDRGKKGDSAEAQKEKAEKREKLHAEKGKKIITQTEKQIANGGGLADDEGVDEDADMTSSSWSEWEYEWEHWRQECMASDSGNPQGEVDEAMLTNRRKIFEDWLVQKEKNEKERDQEWPALQQNATSATSPASNPAEPQPDSCGDILLNFGPRGRA